MTRLEAALLDLGAFLDEHHLPYMVIGGFANLHWGSERFTRDVDLSVEVADEALPDLLKHLESRFSLAVADPLEFVRRTHLVRLTTRTGVDADLMIAVLPYEREAIRRAVAVDVAGRTVRLCTPEDLVIYKLASERPQDAVDVEGIVMRQGARLDREYLWPRVRDLVAGLERPEVETFFTKALAKADAAGGDSDG